jgi:hypothetical protein
LHEVDRRRVAGLAGLRLETAELIHDERERQEFLSVSAGLAVLAGIAASDSICCARLHHLHRGGRSRTRSAFAFLAQHHRRQAGIGYA